LTASYLEKIDAKPKSTFIVTPSFSSSTI